MPNEQMAENLRKAIANKQYCNYSFSITTDGNFEFKEVIKDDLLTANQYIFDTTDRNFRVNFLNMIDSAPFPEIVR